MGKRLKGQRTWRCIAIAFLLCFNLQQKRNMKSGFWDQRSWTMIKESKAFLPTRNCQQNTRRTYIKETFHETKMEVNIRLCNSDWFFFICWWIAIYIYQKILNETELNISHRLHFSCCRFSYVVIWIKTIFLMVSY